MQKPDYKIFSGRDYVREIVRMRDKHTCRYCKRKWYEGERRFDVHHTGGLCGEKSLKYDRIADINGLITLCHSCHLNTPDAVGNMIKSDHSHKGVDKISVMNLHKKGMNQREIARRFGCSYQRIYKVLKSLLAA